MPGIIKLLIALRFYAVGAFYQVIGDLFGVSAHVVRTTVIEVSYLIATKLRNRFIVMPETQQELLNAKAAFMRRSGFPLCIAAIDGTHALIQSYGGDNAEIYRNRKMVFSHNVQVAVSADVISFCYSNTQQVNIEIYYQQNSFLQDRVLDIVSRWPGSAHDSTIFTHSNLYQRFCYGDFGDDSLMVADIAYPPAYFVCKPLEHANTINERIYQYRQVRARNVVERVNGQLKRRFAILRLGTISFIRSDLFGFIYEEFNL